MFNSQDSTTVNEAQDQLVTNLVSAETETQIQLIEKKLKVLRDLKQE